MRRGAQVFDNVCIDQANIDVIDAEHLRITDQYGLETGREQGWLVGRLR